MSISIDGISNAYTTNTDTSTNKLESTLNSNLSDATDDDLMDACKQFEAYFIEQAYKAMENTIPKNDEDTSSSTTQLTDYYKDELIQQYADTTSEQGTLGFAEQLYEQMKRNYNIS